MRNLTLRKIIAGVLIVLVILLIGMHHHQRTHFNRNVRINNIPVGGLTAEQAYHKVRHTRRQSKVYVNGQLVYRGKPTQSGFDHGDQARITKALDRQYSFFPSHRHVTLIVEPAELDKSAVNTINAAVDQRLQQLNAARQ